MEVYQVTRKLAAVLHADVQGYSRLLGEAEEATLRVLGTALSRMTTLVAQHGGRAVGSRGDSLLAEFPSVVAAVRCAVAMQRELRGINADLPVERRVEFRMGINLGEIVVEGEQLHGDGINIAVRLEGLAEAGGICLSEVVYEQVRHRVPLQSQRERLPNAGVPASPVTLSPSKGAQRVLPHPADEKKRREGTAPGECSPLG
jgi:adenylate cyclase